MEENLKAPIHNKNKTAFLTTLTVSLEAMASRIKDTDYRTIVVAIIPLFSLAITFILKNKLNRYKCKKSIVILNGWITLLRDEIEDSSTSLIRRKEAQREIVKYQKELKRMQKDFIELDFN